MKLNSSVAPAREAERVHVVHHRAELYYVAPENALGQQLAGPQRAAGRERARLIAHCERIREAACCARFYALQYMYSIHYRVFGKFVIIIISCE